MDHGATLDAVAYFAGEDGVGVTRRQAWNAYGGVGDECDDLAGAQRCLTSCFVSFV